MERLKGTDRFRQLLQKFDQPKPGTSHDTSIRKSSRTVKKPNKFDASPCVPKTKESKSRYESVRHENKAEPRVISGERRGGSNITRELVTGIDLGAPIAGTSRGKQIDSRKISGEHGGRSGKGHDKSRKQTEEDPGAGDSGSSRGKRQDLREEITCHEPSSPRRSAFRLLATENNCNPSASRLILREPASQPTRRNQDLETSYMPDHRRKRDLEYSYMSDRRRQHDYEQSYVAEKRMVDKYSEMRDVFAKPRPISYSQSGWRPNASKIQDIYGNIRQPVVVMEDILSRTRERSAPYRSKLEIPPKEFRQSSLVDIMKTREREALQQSRMLPPPPDHPKRFEDGFLRPPDRPKRFEGGFLRPPTPPGLAGLLVEEQTKFIDTLKKFKNFTLCSTIEIIFMLNHLENSLINKMSKTRKQNYSAQSELRTTMMESVPEESLKSYMVQSWLNTNDSIAPPEAESRKRRHEKAGNLHAKRMRMADGD